MGAAGYTRKGNDALIKPRHGPAARLCVSDERVRRRSDCPGELDLTRFPAERLNRFSSLEDKSIYYVFIISMNHIFYPIKDARKNESTIELPFCPWRC